MSKVEELLKDNKLAEKLSMAKLNDLLKKEEEDKKPSKAVIIFAIIGVLVAVAAAAYGIYRFFTPDYLDDGGYICSPHFSLCVKQGICSQAYKGIIKYKER